MALLVGIFWISLLVAVLWWVRNRIAEVYDRDRNQKQNPFQ